MTAITGWIVDDWPFCLSKYLDFYTMIFKEDGSNGLDLYEAYCGTNDVWVATQILNAFTTHNPSTNYPINIDFADFGWFYAMAYAEMNSGALGVHCYYRDPDVASSLTCLTALPGDACPTFISCCNFNGQAILGGIVSTSATWTQLGLCSVAWGAIGQFEFRVTQNKTAGYIKMPWSDWDEGMVHKVAKLGKGVMVYGNGGRAALVPYSTQLATGFGLKPLVGPGISKGFHMAGDENLHGFIDTNNEFWIATGNLEFQKLGYKEFIDDMQAENDTEATDLPIIVSYNKYDKRFHISGYSSAYVLTEFGLYSCHQSSTGIGRYRGNVLSGFQKDLGDYEARVSIDDTDFKVRGLKTVDTIEYGVDYPSGGSGGAMAPTSCCTDPDDDKDVTTGWTKNTGTMGSVGGGVTGNCLSLEKVGT
jgi:hypothetical protein